MNDGKQTITQTLTTTEPAKSGNVVSITDRIKRETAIESYEEFSANDDNTDRLNSGMCIAIDAISLAFPGVKFADCDKAFMYECAVAMVMRGKGASHPLHEVIDDVYEQIKDQYAFDDDEDED